MEQDLHHNSLIERLIELQQSAITRELVQPRPDLPMILKLQQRQHHAAELDAGAALLALRVGSLGHRHLPATIASAPRAEEVTKELDRGWAPEESNCHRGERYHSTSSSSGRM